MRKLIYLLPLLAGCASSETPKKTIDSTTLKTIDSLNHVISAKTDSLQYAAAWTAYLQTFIPKGTRIHTPECLNPWKMKGFRFDKAKSAEIENYLIKLHYGLPVEDWNPTMEEVNQKMKERGEELGDSLKNVFDTMRN